MNDWLAETVWLGNPAGAWLLALGGAIVGYALLHAVLGLLGMRVRRAAGLHPQSAFLQMLAAMAGATRAWCLQLLALSLGLRSLLMPAELADSLRWFTVSFIGIQVALWVSAALLAWARRTTPEGSLRKTNPVIHGIITWTIQLFVWVTLLLILMAQAGVHIGAFVASLGIGGIAIAMAAKNVLEDLFASLAIGLDKPFREGDSISFGDDSGTVRKVGIKSTRIDSSSGERIIIGNTRLLEQTIHNFSRMRERRAVFGFRVPLDTPAAKLEAVTPLVNAIIAAEPGVRFERGHFLAIEPEGFRFEFVYFVGSGSYLAWCEAQHNINTRIVSALARHGVDFAMPARRLHRGEDAGGETPAAQQAASGSPAGVV